MTKSVWTTALVALGLSFAVSTLRAGNSDFEFHFIAKRTGGIGKQVHGATMGTDEFGQPKLGSSMTVLGNEEWAYEVTVENKTFHDLTGLEIKYVVFYEDDKAAPSRAHRGGVAPLPTLRNHEKGSFTTRSVRLKTAGRIRAQDALVGIVVRVYQNGQQLAEFANPTSLLQEQ